MVIRINHSGLFLSVNGRYSGDSLIKEIIRRNIALIFGSNAHSPKKVGLAFEGTFEKCLIYQKS